MKNPINLLPTELAPTGKAVKLATRLQNLVFIGFTVFILAAGGAVALFIIDLVGIQSSQQRQTALTNSIKALEATETGLVLVQDRLGIARTILAKSKANDNLAKLSLLLPSVSGGATLSDAEVDSTKTKFSILSTNSLDLAKFMANLVSGDSYGKVDMVSFSFTPTTGYLASFETQTK